MDKARERLKKVRSTLGLTQKQLADKMGMSWYQIKDIETGKVKISKPTAKLLYHEVGINTNWLLTGEGDMFINKGSQADPDQFSYVPLHNITAAAGSGYINDTENIKEFLAFKTTWIRNILHTNSSNLFLIHMIGDSMEPTYISGDIVLVDKSKTNQKDGIYIFRKTAELYIKRLIFDETSISILSDNRLYPPKLAKIGEITILGKAIWYGRQTK